MSNFNNNDNLSISFEIIVASVTATKGGLSNNTISHSSSNFFINSTNFFDPNNSEGFGGTTPEGTIYRFFISDLTITFEKSSI